MGQRLALDAYLERIGYRGPLRADLETLSGLMRAHVLSVPFENLDVLLGRRVRLDLASVQAKLVAAGRGGYCFEHCTLFSAVLETLGFSLVRHTARVVVVFPRDQAPRTHMILVVSLPEGRFVVDPGFGGPGPDTPVPLIDRGAPQPPGATHWMQRDGAHWVLRTLIKGSPADGWITTLDHDIPIDFELGNHYTATHPESAFVNRLMLCARSPEGRVTVMNRDVTITAHGATTSQVLADRRTLRALLRERFGFDLPEVETLRVPLIPDWA